jgi:Pentapeptide repeats (8 copies)
VFGGVRRGLRGHAGVGVRVAVPTAAGQGGCHNPYRWEPGSCYTPGSCRGRYHTDRQPGAALQNTAICPAGPPPARSRADLTRADLTHANLTHANLSYAFWPPDAEVPEG